MHHSASTGRLPPARPRSRRPAPQRTEGPSCRLAKDQSSSVGDGVRHARKAAEAGVDGIIAVCAGAGGHAGTVTPFALLPEIRSFFPGTLVPSGAISTGAHIAAARMMGQISPISAPAENAALLDFKHMILASHAADIVYTAAISGVHGNFLKPSIDAWRVEIDVCAPTRGYEIGHSPNKAWKNVWSAGQGVGSIQDAPPVAALCARLVREYHEALAEAAADLAAVGARASLAPAGTEARPFPPACAPG